MKKKALVIRFSSIGDIVLTTPVIRALHLHGKFEVYYLTHSKYKEVLASNPFIHHIYAHEGDLWITRKWIIRQKFDIIIDLHCSIRSHILGLTIFQKFYGFEKLRMKRWYRTKVKKKLSTDKHIVDRFLDALKPIEISPDKKGLDFFIAERNKVAISNDDLYIHNIALIPGARHFTKTIPLHICQSMIKAFPQVRFHLLGGISEKESTSELNSLTNVANHCGKYNLEQSAYILYQCNLVITTDTALMHIAAAFQKNIISIWGGTIPEFGFTPYLNSANEKVSIIENEELKCRPCSKSGKGECPLHHFNCMNKISTKIIESQIKQYLGVNHFSQNDV